ncbi:uncharacterized protein LOC120708250 [Panicum virgatum]|uniref:Cysteine-rich transmembrane domain-containing protein n=2 Tax=Panicum TaxID=4539 RepID=A0A8T0SR13_PANVG|nr:uncharacterized protein LOC120708250 [Panicum virgatum]KAG2601130.1 hypothetical protein PVAP13_5KG545500 [Panicum virgatum]
MELSFHIASRHRRTAIYSRQTGARPPSSSIPRCSRATERTQAPSELEAGGRRLTTIRMSDRRYGYSYPPPQGYYNNGPPVMAPPQYQYAAPPRREPSFLEGCLAALCCCCLLDECCCDPSVIFVS